MRARALGMPFFARLAIGLLATRFLGELELFAQFGELLSGGHGRLGHRFH